MALEDDDWDWRTEELDSLERDVFQKLAQQCINSASPYERLKELPKLSVKFFLHASGNIATTFPYEQVLVGAVREIPKSSWNAKERLWMFPISSLSSAEKFLHETSGVNVEVENVDPLVHRAIAAASVFGDILGYSYRRAAIHLFSIF
ncbi:hypothetical protein L3X38_001913 [Prunus dulcis]|uniref:HARP domain-containing protein n=1 Tax=Prunus dulcis TaxID=3755 RepID=A0AAD4ZKN7_PRUDU|nr:hypothetical protein L3X38_001913 [Prunus dulcis]